ncbi:heme ABC transporter ATP-binding protein [Deinococcus radiophilus]|uniref:Heme ABC transporter ATP-binding protein n=1 Tax=Deinococcus radiophilus TaxID=32062 RepID=A0A3S0KA14_9DEIO|nr:heme ABC transporter ATP-binding protein [Deinococcus radiophilus]RTR26003.1 heme ABC transporter ATP-binding protein [Deinococcus radiophilus]UFA51846.1 heme ABC transporter ATP-binding protein [Deinococcus radiophilus]
MSTPLLEVADLSYSVAGRELLRRVRLDLSGGEVLVVVGRNGAGKSTLLKHLSGELQAHDVSLFGKDLNSHRRADLARRRAVLAQHTPMSFGYEVLEVVGLGRLPHRGSAAEQDAAARECLGRVGLAGFEHRDILTLSGGEQQRVHLARVLAQLHGVTEARVLLLDEPTSSLDLAHQHQTLRLARELADEGTGVLAILHDLNLAAQYADRMLVLSDGEVLAYGPPAEVLQPGLIAQAFGHDVQVIQHPCLGCPLVVSAG